MDADEGTLRAVGPQGQDDRSVPRLALRVDDDLLALAGRLADEIAETPRFPQVSLFLHDPAVDRVRLVGIHRAAGGPSPEEVRPGEWLMEPGICGNVYRTRQPALVADVHLAVDFGGYPGGTTRSLLITAITFGDQAIGVVMVENRRVSAFEIPDLEALVAWSSLIGPLLGPFLVPQTEG